MIDFLDVIKNRKSIRSFTEKTVDRAIIKKIIESAVYAPTNCNQQLWSFVVVDDQKTKERLVTEAASNTLIRRAPTIIVATYDGWNYKEAVQGASLAVGHILLAAKYYGVHASPMNSYGADTAVKKILNIPHSETICCFVVLGYPDEKAKNAPLVPRRPVEDVIHWGIFEEKKRPPFTYNPDNWTLDDLKNHQKYYCRKTFLGKEMDIMSTFERDLVHKNLKDLPGPIIDIFSYDGAYVREFPIVPIIALDLNTETSEYTKAAAELTAKHRMHSLSYILYNDAQKTLMAERAKAATMIYKAERLPRVVKEKVFKQTYATLETGGEFIIIARKRNLLLSLFFFVIKTIFGRDMRKTGIYNFFGPYKPLNLSTTLQSLREAGFQSIQWSGYFPIPTFYEEVYQMFLQYIKSEGSSYLHRDIRKDVISRTLSRIMKLQGFKKVGVLGSVVVITCKK